MTAAPGFVYIQKATTLSLRNSSSSAKSTSHLRCSSLCHMMRCKTVMICYLGGKLQILRYWQVTKNLKDGLNKAAFSQSEFLRICEYLTTHSDLSSRLSALTAFSSTTTVSMGNTCFLTQVTHQLHLILLWPTFLTLLSFIAATYRVHNTCRHTTAPSSVVPDQPYSCPWDIHAHTHIQPSF